MISMGNHRITKGLALVLLANLFASAAAETCQLKSVEVDYSKKENKINLATALKALDDIKQSTLPRTKVTVGPNAVMYVIQTWTGNNKNSSMRVLSMRNVSDTTSSTTAAAPSTTAAAGNSTTAGNSATPANTTAAGNATTAGNSTVKPSTAATGATAAPAGCGKYSAITKNGKQTVFNLFGLNPAGGYETAEFIRKIEENALKCNEDPTFTGCTSDQIYLFINTDQADKESPIAKVTTLSAEVLEAIECLKPDIYVESGVLKSSSSAVEALSCKELELVAASTKCTVDDSGTLKQANSSGAQRAYRVGDSNSKTLTKHMQYYYDVLKTAAGTGVGMSLKDITLDQSLSTTMIDSYLKTWKNDIKVEITEEKQPFGGKFKTVHVKPYKTKFNRNAKKKVRHELVFTAGLNAGHGSSTTFAMMLIQKLVTEPPKELMDFDYVIIPAANMNGLLIRETLKDGWTKSADNFDAKDLKKCSGSNLHYNFGPWESWAIIANKGNDKSSDNPCSEYYRGKTKYSANATKFIVEKLKSTKIALYVDIRSAPSGSGSAIMWPMFSTATKISTGSDRYEALTGNLKYGNLYRQPSGAMPPSHGGDPTEYFYKQVDVENTKYALAVGIKNAKEKASLEFNSFINNFLIPVATHLKGLNMTVNTGGHVHALHGARHV